MLPHVASLATRLSPHRKFVHFSVEVRLVEPWGRKRGVWRPMRGESFGLVLYEGYNVALGMPHVLDFKEKVQNESLFL